MAILVAWLCGIVTGMAAIYLRDAFHEFYDGEDDESGNGSV